MKTADPELMRAINRFVVMDTVRRFGPLARVEISERTELSPTTVSAITGALIDDGLIVPRTAGGVHEPSRGRPRTLLELNPDAAAVVGVVVAANRLTCAATNFRGDVISELAMPVRVARQPTDVAADLIEDAIRHCVVEAGLTLEQVNEICVAVPGRIEHDAGIVRDSPTFRDPDVPLADALRRRVGRPFSIESLASAVAMAESWFGAAREAEDFVVLTAGETVECCLVHKGEILRGAGGLSADLGPLFLDPEDSGAVPAVRLAGRASEAAIVEGAGDGRPDAHTRLADIVAAAAAGRSGPAEALARAGNAIGTALAHLVVIFSPRLVIVTGTLAGGGPIVEQALRARVAQVVPPGLARIAEIAVAEPDERHWARGAAAHALRDLYGAPWNTTGPARKS